MQTFRITPKFLRSLTISAVVFFMLSSCKEGEKQKKEQPNLLFIFPDQYRAQAVGFTGEDPVVTPNLDHLAEQSKVLVNAVSTRPLSSPFRGMLMTGKYPHENGILTNCNTSSRKYGNYLKEEQTAISDILSSNGYLCGYIGKWHLDAPRGPDVDDWRKAKWTHYTPPGRRHGFEFWHAYGCKDQHMNPYYWIGDAPREDTTFVDKWSPVHEADVAIDFIKDNRNDGDKPWALFVSMNPPHPPYNAVPDRYRRRYDNMPMDSLLYRDNVPEGKDRRRAERAVRGYFSMVTGVDEQVGRILQALEE